MSRGRTLLFLEPLEERTLLTVNWINPAGGDWGTPANWSGGAVPTSADDVLISVPGGVTITHAQGTADTIHSLKATNLVNLSLGNLTVLDTLQDTSPFTLAGGTLSRAIVSAGTTIVATGFLSGGTLDGVTLAGTLDATVFGLRLTVTGGLTLDRGMVNLGIGQVVFDGTQALSGTGDVVFNAASNGNTGLLVPQGAAFTIAPGVTIRGKSGFIGNNAAETRVGSFLNQGTIKADVAGGAIDLNGANWTNAGTIQAANGGGLGLFGKWANDGPLGVDGGGTLALNGKWSNTSTVTSTNNSTVNLGGTFTRADLGTLHRTGGTVSITGTLVNTGTTLVLDDATGSWQLAGGSTVAGGGTILGGTVSTAGGARLIATGFLSGGTLDGVTLAGTLDATVFGLRLTVTGGLTLDRGTVNLGIGQVVFAGTQVLSGTGDVVFNAASNGNTGLLVPQGAAFTIAPGVTIRGKSGFIGNNAAETRVGSFLNQGTIKADVAGGAIDLNGANWTNTGIITSTIGFIFLNGTFDNRGKTLVLNDATGSYYLNYGTILGGTVSTEGSAKLIGLRNSGVLAGVTLAGTLDMASLGAARVNVIGGLTLDHGAIDFAAGSRLSFQGTQGLTGTGTVSFNGVVSDDSALLVPANGDTLTIAPGIILRGASGFIGSAAGGALNNQGTIVAQAGGTLTVRGLSNILGGALTGGSWEAVGNSTLRILGANIVTNAATLLLEGANSHLYSDGATTDALAGLATNAAAGSLTIRNGAKLSTGAFSNQGSLTVGAGSTFTAGGNYSTGGGTVVDGSLVANNTVTVNGGGSLAGSGTVRANVVNNGLVSPGNPTGILTVNGAYTQTSAGALNVEIGGTTAGSQHDRVGVTGLVTLAGSLNISTTNGFGPTQGQSFQLMTFGSRNGAFDTINGLRSGDLTLFTANLGAADLILNAAATGADLAFDSVTIPAGGTSGRDATVQYTVRNRTTAPAQGDWFDSIYLTTGVTFDPSARLLGRVHHVGNVAGQGSYTETLTAPLPNLIDAGYHVVVVVDSRGLVSDSDRSNNTGISGNAFHVSVPLLTIGVPITGTIAEGQDIYFRMVVPPGQDLTISADFAVAMEAELDLRQAALPDRSTFDQTAADLSDLKPHLFLPTPQGGSYYLLLHGREGAAGGKPFTIKADIAPFGVTDFSPPVGYKARSMTLSIVGAGFTPRSTVSLDTFSTSSSLPGSQVQYVDSGHLTAIFDTSELSPGNYLVHVEDAGQTSIAPRNFRVGTGGNLSVTTYEPPKTVYVGATIPLRITATNTGDAPVTAPYIIVQATGVVPQTGNDPNDMLPGMFAPTEPGQPVNLGPSYKPNPVGVGNVSGFSEAIIKPNETAIDWNAQKESLRPSTIPTDAWDAIWPNFLAVLGNHSLGDLFELLRDDQAQLAMAGVTTNSISRLTNFEIQKANNMPPLLTMGSPVDAALAAPGLPLVFQRTFGQTIAERYHLGRLGRGWTDAYDISASTDNMGNVLIRHGGGVRGFAKLSGTLQAVTPGDTGTLSVVNGSYRLLEKNGLLTAFRTDGLLDFIQDTNNNRITAGYTGAQLITLTHSSGTMFTLSYNTQGRISQLADSTGRVTSYSYDDVGEHLLSVTTSAGTVAYGYSADTSGPTAHAVTSITNADETHRYFAYDIRGRLIEQQRDGGTDKLTYAYDSAAFRVTDAMNHSSTFFFDDFGSITRTMDPLGQLGFANHDARNNLVNVGMAGSAPATFGYEDARGNVTNSVDPLGQRQDFTYDPASGRLTGWRDAMGNTTSYSHDVDGNLLSTNFADGSTEGFTYNTQGEVVNSVDRNGQIITFSYDSRGLPLTKDLPDGTHFTYSYDAHGNMLSASGPQGATTMNYDAADRPTQITYPNGRALQYSYGIGGRLTQTIQDGFVANYAYDAAGRLQSMTGGNGAAIVGYTYDSAGRLQRQDNGNGTYTTYDYDAAGQLLHLVNLAPTGTVDSRFDYSYDNLGRRDSMTTLDGRTDYGYDPAGRLTSVTLPGGRNITYAYDLQGNRTTVTDDGAATSYHANNLNEYTSIGGTNQSFDAGGNQTSTSGQNGLASYTYDAEGHLLVVATSTDNWTYEYDALGLRSASTHNGVRTEYLVDPTGQIVAEYEGNGQFRAHYTAGLGLTSRVDASGQSAYYNFDALGNTAQLTGAGGEVLDAYSYLPFGEALTSQATVPNAFTFSGRFGVTRDGSGLDFMRHRFYDSAQGRFTQADPVGLAGGTNLYAYAANNPVTFADPSGLGPIPGATLVAKAIERPSTISGVTEIAVTMAGIPADVAIDVGTTAATGQQIDPSDLPGTIISSTFSIPGVPGAGDAVGIALDPKYYPDIASGLVGIDRLGHGGVLNKNEQQQLVNDANFHSSGELPPCVEGIVGSLVKLVGLCNPVVIPVVTPSGGGDTTQVAKPSPIDPNYISGPGGFGPKGYLTPDQALPYFIEFENLAAATAPAQLVVITQQLDPNLDWTTFQLGEFGFGDTTITIPAGRNYYYTRIDARSSRGVFIDVTAGINFTTGLATWTFNSIDPTTLDVPEDPLVGFLPPDRTSPEGVGFVTYTVGTRSSLSTGAAINAQASVVFNTNAPLDTNTIVNTIDTGPPTSTVAPLPNFSLPSFTVDWSGADDPGGSGLATFDVFSSDNGGPFQPLLTGTTLKSTTFTGVVGHTYGFYTVATDNVGFVEAIPSSAQATTTTRPAQQPTTLSAVSGTGIYGSTTILTATLSANGSPLAGKAIHFTLTLNGSNTSLGAATTDANGVATLSGTDLTGLDAGNYAGVVGAAFAADATDFASVGRGDLTVNKAEATLRLGTLAFTYDRAPHAATVTTSPAGIAGVAITYTRDNVAVAAPTQAGSYSVLATLTNPIVAAADVTGTLVIARATPSVSWADPGDITYGTALGTRQLDASASVAGTFTYALASGTVLDAGQGQTLAATFTASDAADYNSVMIAAHINVARAPLSVSANDAVTTYGAVVLRLAGTVVGLQNLDPITAAYSSGDTASSPAGTYAITPVLLDPNRRLRNYAVSLSGGTLTVNKAPLTVTADDASAIEGGPNPSFSAHYSGFVLGEGPGALSGRLSINIPADALGHAGQYAITPGGLTAGNYAISYVSGTLNVAPRPVPLVVVLDVINDGAAQRSMVKSLAITFSLPITVDPGAFEVRNQDGSPVGLIVATSIVEGKTVAVLTFIGPDILGGSLADGRYTLTVHGDRVHDDGGRPLDGDLDGVPEGDYVDTAISRLFGDLNGDGSLDNAESFLFKNAINKSVGQVGYLSQFDFNGDGKVETSDFVEMKKRYGKKPIPMVVAPGNSGASPGARL